MKTKERILILQILPHKGRFEELIIIEDIRKKVNLTQEEILKIEFETVISKDGTQESYKWNSEKDIDKKIEFTEAEKNIIKKSLKEIEEEGELNFGLLELYKTYAQ